jgi:ferredoxin
MVKVEVTVRPDRCVGSGLCQELDPRGFVFNEQGVSEWRETAEQPDLTRLRKIAHLCPVQAIEVVVHEDACGQ